MKICKNCQFEFDESHNFCSKCGSRLEKIVKYETLRTEYFLSNPRRGRIFYSSGGGVHFRRFIYNDDHYYVSEGKLWKEEIISGNRTFIAELDSCYKNEDNTISELFLFVNKEGIIVYSMNLDYLFYFPHNSNTGINYCQRIINNGETFLENKYLCDNIIFYSIQNYENQTVKLNEDQYYNRTLPRSMTKNNSYIEMFDVLTGKKETILSSFYLGNIYIDPTMYYGNNLRICGNKEYLVFSVNIHNTADIDHEREYGELTDYLMSKEVKVLFNLNTKEIQILQTDELNRNFLFFDASKNQIWYQKRNSNIYQKYDIESDTTEEYELNFKTSPEYFDGIDAFTTDDFSIYKLYNDGSMSENLRTDSYMNLRDGSYFKTDKWLMVQGEGNPGVTEEYLYFEKGANSPTYKSVFDFENQL